MTIGSYILAALTLLLVIPTGIFSLEIISASFLRHGLKPAAADLTVRQRLAVIVPAHNESSVIHSTLLDIRNELGPQDRLLVVVDNCTDDTADIAASLGAEVTLRNDPTKIGKGYALDWGLKRLQNDPPDTVIMIDADCRIIPGAVRRLAAASAILQRPVQCLYLMTSPPDSSVNHQVAEFAWRIKNYVRPLGLSALSLPCHLMGTGMAFPWRVLGSANLAVGSIVEDLQLGLELARAGHAAHFYPSAIVTSTFPSFAEGARKQRQRWEHGHIRMILKEAPALLWASLTERNLNLLVLVLDLLVPPLSLLWAVLLVSLIATGSAALLGFAPVSFVISSICLGLAGLTTGLAWHLFARDVLPLHSIVLIPRYFASKLIGYLAAALGGDKVSQWTRADRDR
jgi:cellulose synthase/poly-beta-1,6-N-acetylglucosamine synthase-like glycosyltransferase